MKALQATAPTTEALAKGLQQLLAPTGGGLSVLARHRNWYTSSSHSELVEVSVDGRIATVFCKNGEDYVDATYGHRRGVRYESEVYARVVAPTGAPSPRYLGSFESNGGITLVLGHVRQSLRLHDTAPGLAAPIVRAAAALGAWHERASSRVVLLGEGLNRFESDHFLRWESRARFAPGATDAFRYLSDRVTSLPVAEALAAAEPAVAHGELFTSNALVDDDGKLFFVDWESAGLGPGELDLAALAVGAWPDATRTACVQAYVDARFGGQPPPTFRPALAAAELYVLSLLARHTEQRAEDPAHQPWFRAQTDAAARTLRLEL